MGYLGLVNWWQSSLCRTKNSQGVPSSIRHQPDLEEPDQAPEAQIHMFGTWNARQLLVVFVLFFPHMLCSSRAPGPQTVLVGQDLLSASSLDVGRPRGPWVWAEETTQLGREKCTNRFGSASSKVTRSVEDRKQHIYDLCTTPDRESITRTFLSF